MILKVFRYFTTYETGGTRTLDNLIKSQVLYRLSYNPKPKNVNRASWIRTSECRSQSPVPYRLAIALIKKERVDKGTRTLGLQSHNLAR